MLEGLLTMSRNELKRLAIVQKIVEKNLTQAIGAQQLGLTDRQVRRLVRNYKLDGAEGLTSKQRGQTGNRKYSDEKIESIKSLVVKHYYDFGPKFAAEKLYEKHCIKVNKETLRQWMVEWGLWKAKRQKHAQIHPQRDRRDCFGELTQIGVPFRKVRNFPAHPCNSLPV
jgi:transposase